MGELSMVVAEEPRTVLGRGEFFGFPWLVRHSGHGIRCGYIFVPGGHPWADQEEPNCEVHGGVTFCERHDDGTWFGFDANHAWDGRDPSLLDPDDPSIAWINAYEMPGTVIRTTEYMVAECARLCMQAADAWHSEDRSLPMLGASLARGVLLHPLDRNYRYALADWLDENGFAGGNELRGLGRIVLSVKTVWFHPDSRGDVGDHRDYICLGLRESFSPVCEKCGDAITGPGCHIFGKWLHWQCGASEATKRKQSDWEWRRDNEE